MWKPKPATVAAPICSTRSSAKPACVAFIEGSGAAIIVALIAVFIGLLITWIGFPHQQQELALET